jgi:hydrogenase maturation factor
MDALLATLPQDKRVLLGPGPGRDAAVVQLPDRYLVLAADPVSFTAHNLGRYAVHVNANDIACLGADPRWFLATVLLPPDTDQPTVDTIFTDLRTACGHVGASLVGGHTEVSASVTQPLIAGTMIGEAPRNRLFPSDAAQPDDIIIQIGPIATEGTALLAREIPQRLRDRGLTDDEITHAASLLDEPGISILPAARAAWPLPGLHTLHDPTEGGLATACAELADANHLGLVINRSEILIHPVTERITTALDLDPLGLLASGALLLTSDPHHADDIVRALQHAGHNAAPIGHLGAPNQPAILRAHGETRPLPRFARDEVVRGLSESS